MARFCCLAELACAAIPPQDRFAKQAPSPLTDLLPPALPAALSSSSSACCREAGSIEPLANPCCSSLPPPYPTVPVFLLNLVSPFSWNSSGWRMAGRRRAGTWPRVAAGLSTRCWDAQECPSRSFTLSFLSLALLKIFQSPSDGSQMCPRCFCLAECWPASCALLKDVRVFW